MTIALLAVVGAGLILGLGIYGVFRVSLSKAENWPGYPGEGGIRR